MSKTDQLKITPQCAPENIVQGDCYRFTILTPCLIRMEYNEAGIFEDRATQTVLHRDFEPRNFQVIDGEEGLQLLTEAVHILYDKKKFSRNGLTVKLRGNFTVYHSVWNYSEPAQNLGGTARTLDGADGPIELEPGLLSRNGFSILDDSKSLLIREDGWLEPREEGIIDLYFFGYGRDYRSCLKDYYRLTGATPMLPRYALGNWWSRFYRYTEESYKALVEHFEAEQIPFTVAVMDMDWHLTSLDPQYGSGWTGYTWNRELFPDPPGFMSWLHEKGMRITLNVHPADGVRPHEEMYEEMAGELGVNKESRTALPIPFDLTDREFLKAYFKYLHHPNERAGVDFWWIDWQQGSSSRMEGMDPLWMLNHFHFLDQSESGKRALILSRYAGPGSHRYPIGFSGDTVISWETLRFQPYFTATASNIGFGWWSHDIGGHMNGIRDDELAARWLQFGVFSPIMRLHSSGSLFNGKEPWRYNRIVHEIMKNFLRLRHRLLPYLYTMSYRCSVEGEPLIQPMYYQYPESAQAYEAGNQYYFGTELIVVPVTEAMDRSLNLAPVKVWLPEGIYIDFFCGRIYEGGRCLEMYRSLAGLPVLARAGGIVPMRAGEETGNDISNPERLDIRIFGGEDGRFCLYEDDGESLEYEDGAWVKTNMVLDWRKGYCFRIEAAQGRTELIPDHRYYRLSFSGFRDCREIMVTSEGKKVKFQQEYDTGRNSIELILDKVRTDRELLVQFGDRPQLADNRIEGELLSFLDQAQIEFQLKERIYGLVRANLKQGHADAAKIITELHALGLNRNLFGVLCEILLVGAVKQ